MSILTITDENFNEEILKSSDKTLVYFYDNKKNSSRIFEEIILKVNKEIGNEVKIFKISSDDSEKSKAKFGIMSIPTMIYFISGELDRKIVGIRQKDEIITMLK